ncbi:hypothetical protein NE237_007358 [Protea cynaroides]|uniref:Protein TIC 214 n=1 Tax=Protea cynaroides TaxID=273540 RepID=A0A9Q0KQ07_9MAGN|nr:hypothetical protein NE237_007358 [Protea cynaroides]
MRIRRFFGQNRQTFFLWFLISGIVTIWMGKNKNTEFKTLDSSEKRAKQEEKQKEERKENERIARGCILVIQSILRKYLVLPLLIIAKNIVRILLFQPPEWYEDLKEWNREVHVKCTYNGVQLSEREFPKNWLIEGIQIKILFPFRPKPWRRSKLRSHHRDPSRPR